MCPWTIVSHPPALSQKSDAFLVLDNFYKKLHAFCKLEGSILMHGWRLTPQEMGREALGNPSRSPRILQA